MSQWLKACVVLLISFSLVWAQQPLCQSELAIEQVLNQTNHLRLTFFITEASNQVRNCTLSNPCFISDVPSILTTKFPEFYNTTSDRIAVLTFKLVTNNKFSPYLGLPTRAGLKYMLVIQSHGTMQELDWLLASIIVPLNGVTWLIFKNVYLNTLFTHYISYQIGVCQCRGKWHLKYSELENGLVYMEHSEMEALEFASYKLSLFLIRNCTINNLNLLDVVATDRITFENTEIYSDANLDTRFSIMQGTVCEIRNCIFQGMRPLTIVGYDKVSVSNNTFLKSRQLRFESCVEVNIQNCQLSASIDRALDFKNVKVTTISQSQFSFVNGSAIYYDSSFSKYSQPQTSLTVSGCTFENGTCDIGCALYIPIGNQIKISNSKFIGNVAQKTGGAIFIDYASISFSTCLFENNRVTYQRSDAFTYGQYYGSGGAVSSFSYLTLVDNNFVRNFAQVGGAIYADTDMRGSNFFLNNRAWKGGAMFRPQPFTSLNDATFEGNVAEYFGNDTLEGLLYINYSAEPNYSVRSGSVISFAVDLYSFIQWIPADIEKLILIPSQNNIHVELIQNISAFTVHLFLTENISQPQQVSLRLEAEWYFDFHEFLNITMYPCEEDEQLVERNGVTVVECIPFPHDPTGLILSVTIPVSIVLIIMSTIFGLVCGMFGFVSIKDIRKRLSRLKEKEIAEANVEQKILDKAIIFNVESDGELSAPLLERSSDYDRSFIIAPKDLDLIKKIAEGGNGVVYLGKWKGVDVAIKAIKSDLEGNDEEFEQEVSLLASLHHPYILNFYGVCITDSSKYMVTEYLENGSLDRLLYQCRNGQMKLTFLQKLKMLYEVTAGMDYLHSLDPIIVHRDLVCI